VLALAAPAHASINANKSFSPDVIQVGQTSTVTIFFLNPNPDPATGVGFTDNLPPGVTVAVPSGASTGLCGGTLTPNGPGTSVTYALGTIPAASGTTPGSCSISFNVTATAADVYINTIAAGDVSSSEGANSQTTQATLNVSSLSPITGTKTFAPTNIHGGGDVSLATITLNNPNAVALTNVSFTDTLPAQIVVASPPVAATSCGGMLTANAGTGTVTLAGGSISAGSSCTVTFGVTAANPNAFFNANVTNQLAAGAVTTFEGAINNAMSVTLRVQTGAQVVKAFAPSTINSGQASTLTVTVNNFNATALSTLGFVDALPAGMTIASPAATGGTCLAPPQSATFSSAVVGAASYTTSGGTLAGTGLGAGITNTSCTFTINVTATNASSTPRNLTNNIPAGNFGGVGYAASNNAVLTILLPSPLGGSKSFSLPNGPAVQTNWALATVVITNSAATPATNLAVTDLLTTMGTGYTFRASPAATTNCGGAFGATGGTTMAFTGGTIPAGGSCTLTFPVQIAANATTGTRTNTIATGTGVTATVAASTVVLTSPITATLAVGAALGVSKAWSPNPVLAGADSRLTVTLSHANGAVAFTNLAFTDTLPAPPTYAQHVVSATPNVVSTCGGTVTANPGALSFSLANGALGVGTTSCTIALNVTTPAGAGAGLNSIAVGAVTSTNEGVANVAAGNATLNRIVGVVSLAKSFTPATVALNGTSVMRVRILNNQPGSIALSAVALTDTLPAGMVVHTTPAASWSGTGCGGGAGRHRGCRLVDRGDLGQDRRRRLDLHDPGDRPRHRGGQPDQRAAGERGDDRAGCFQPRPGRGDARVDRPHRSPRDQERRRHAGDRRGHHDLHRDRQQPDAGTAGRGDAGRRRDVRRHAAGGNDVHVVDVHADRHGDLHCVGQRTDQRHGVDSVGQTLTYSISAAISPGATGSITNTATIDPPSSVVDSNPANNAASDTDTVVQTVALAVTKTDNSLTYVPGGTGTYVVTVVNNGPSNGTGINFADTLPAGVTINAPGVSCTPTGSASCGSAGANTIGTASVAFTGMAIAAGAGNQVQVTIPVAYAANLSASSITNTATVTHVASGATVSGSDSSSRSPNLAFTVSKDDGTATYQPGTTATYTVVVTNTGATFAASVAVADTFARGRHDHGPGGLRACGHGLDLRRRDRHHGLDVVRRDRRGDRGRRHADIHGARGVRCVDDGRVDHQHGRRPGHGSAAPTAGNGRRAGQRHRHDRAPGPRDREVAHRQFLPGPVRRDVRDHGRQRRHRADDRRGVGRRDGARGIQPDVDRRHRMELHAALGPVHAERRAEPGLLVCAADADRRYRDERDLADGEQATVSGGGQPAGTAANDVATDSAVVNVGIDLAVSKVHAGNFFQGQVGAQYTIGVTNAGGTPTSGTVTVTDTLPSGLTATAISGSSWSCTQPAGPCSRSDILGAGASYPTITVTVNVASNAPASLTNGASVATAGDVNALNDIATDPTTITPGPDLSIAKSHAGSFFQGQVGATFTISVSNVGGSATVGTVTVSDTLPVGLTATSIAGTNWSCTQPAGPCSRATPLAPAGSFEPITLTVDVAAGASTPLVNQATVAGGGDVNPANNTANDTVTVAPGPDLAIAKSHVGSFFQGQVGATFTIAVSNVGGSATVGTVTVSDTLPSGLAATSIAGTNWSCTQPVGPCTRSTPLAPAGSYEPITLTVNVAASAGTPLVNQATVTGGGDVNPANNTSNDSVTVALGPDLAIAKSHTGNFFQGQVGATFTIAVSNVGGSATVGTVTVSDTLPSGLTATSIAGTNWSCTQPAGPCTRSTPLAPAGSFEPITLTVDVAAGAGTPLVNQATVAGGGDVNPANNTSNDSVTVALGPDLAIAKSHTSNFFQGQVGATFTIAVTNVGGSATVGTVTVTDVLPAGLTASSITGTNWSCTQPAGPCTRSTPLAPAGSYEPITLTVNVAASAGTPLVNHATVAGGGDVNPANNTSNDSVTVSGGPDLAIAKSHSGNFFQTQVGATFTIAVTNVGGSATVGTVTVSDLLPTGLTATSIAGANWSCTQPAGPCTRATPLAPAGSYEPITLTVNVAADATSPLINTATVAGGGDVNPSNNSADDTVTVDLRSIDITATPVCIDNTPYVNYVVTRPGSRRERTRFNCNGSTPTASFGRRSPDSRCPGSSCGRARSSRGVTRSAGRASASSAACGWWWMPCCGRTCAWWRR
jgi:uncharacterized repeat protein (TIGR01451 family)